MSRSGSTHPPVPVGQVNEVVLEVAELSAAEGFYTRVLGFPVIDRWAHPHEAVWCLAGGCRIGLWLPQTGIARSRGGTRVHFALSVTDGDYPGLVTLLRARGATVHEVEWSRGARSAFVSDPDFNVVEFWTFDPLDGLPGSPRARSDGVFGLDDVPVRGSRPVPDPDAAHRHTTSCYWRHDQACWSCRSTL